MRKKLWVFIALVFAILIAGIGYSHATRQQRRHVEGTSGGQMYAMYCARCHGLDGRGSSTYPSLLHSSMELDDFAKLLVEGRSKMPPFEGTFLDSEVEPLFRHLQRLKP